jgi:hypothetical protein
MISGDWRKYRISGYAAYLSSGEEVMFLTVSERMLYGDGVWLYSDIYCVMRAALDEGTENKAWRMGEMPGWRHMGKKMLWRRTIMFSGIISYLILWKIASSSNDWRSMSG